jgi:hypothetical protein
MTTTPTFDTDEVLWYNNGKWGSAGYAIPNPSGKTFTNNSVIAGLVSLVGRNLFELTHREDVKFYRAPHKQFWYDLHQLLITARKRIDDRTRRENDSNGLVAVHATPAPSVFVVYPVPYFGERVRQNDVREYTQICLMMLSEMMQHSDNEVATYITPSFAGTVGKYLQEILALFSTKYFGKTRADAYKPDFALTDADFTGYDSSKVMTSVEMSEERPPLQWWPTENDLSQIRGLPINEALLLSKRWPVGNWMDMADGNAFPDPTNQTVETGTNGSGVVPVGSAGGAGGAAVVGFVPPPGQAP